jgi:multiple sugar transport system substrate-binding protein
MTRPSTEAHYLASLVPSSVRGQQVNRRTLLKGASLLAVTPALLAACSSSSSTSTTSSGAAGAATGTVTFGSNYSDAKPKAALAAALDSFSKANPGLTTKVNTIDHNTFQENINNYLQGAPDDVFAWFAGYRMRFFAKQGLAGDISDVWAKTSGLSNAMKVASTGDDGKQYFIPYTNYPWAVFYRKSLWQSKGYTPPKTLDELKTLGAQMKKDGLDPIAFGDKDGWPAMGTFDVLNMRINGYDYHISLMAGKEDWAGDKVKKVFDTWKGLLDLHQADPLGRTWQEAAKSLQQSKSGMYLLGLFVNEQFGADEQEDIDFFTFPEIDSAIGSDALDAPIDGFMMSAKPKNSDGAKALLQYMTTAPAQNAYVGPNPGAIAINSDAVTTGYTSLQKKAATLISSAKSIAQFMDRDTRPDFASTVMIPAIQDFLKTPADIDGLVKKIQQQKVSIFGS